VNRFGFPDLGLGLGLRAAHAAEAASRPVAVGFFELLSENHLDVGGRRAAATDAVAAKYPTVLHGVSMNLGSTDPLDRAYLRKLDALAARTGARWVSDHLCWTGVAGRNTHDLLPLPYTEAALRHFVDRVRAAQDALGRRIAIENPSTYMEYADSTIPEAAFLARVAEDADCALLLDVNNVYVSARNHGFDPLPYLAELPADRVVQIHLAGHTELGTHALDTHDGPVIPPVWDLYAAVIERTGPVSTLLEWDDRIPPLATLEAEIAKAAQFRDAAAAERTTHAA
jgi:uncharacterized protein (UPF0276 family)